jgi:Flp pilus assembly protein TadD
MGASYERACVLYDLKRTDLAERELRGALAEQPDDPYCHALLSHCLIDRRQLDEAERESEEAVRLAPDLSLAHYARARLWSARDNYRKARTAILEAIRLSPRNAEYFSSLAAYYHNAGQYRKGLEAAEKGLEIDPLNVSCINVRALALVRLGRTKEARETSLESIARDPVDAASRAIHGSTCLQQADYAQALSSFLEALRLDPLCERAHRGRRCARTGLALTWPAIAIGRALTRGLWPLPMRRNEPGSRSAGWRGCIALVALGSIMSALAARDTYIGEFVLTYTAGITGAVWILSHAPRTFFLRFLQSFSVVLFLLLSRDAWRAPVSQETLAVPRVVAYVATPIAVIALAALEAFLIGVTYPHLLGALTSPWRWRRGS